MRKLKLQINISLDGIVSWQDFQPLWNDELREFSIENLRDVDSILLGSHTASGLIRYWAGVAEKTTDKDYELGKRITEIQKFVFSRSVAESPWPNTTIVGWSAARRNRAAQEHTGQRNAHLWER